MSEKRDNPAFAQWRAMRIERFVDLAMEVPEDCRRDYLRVQARSLVEDALMFSRAGVRDDDPMPDWHSPPG